MRVLTPLRAFIDAALLRHWPKMTCSTRLAATDEPMPSTGLHPQLTTMLRMTRRSSLALSTALHTPASPPIMVWLIEALYPAALMAESVTGQRTDDPEENHQSEAGRMNGKMPDQCNAQQRGASNERKDHRQCECLAQREHARAVRGAHHRARVMTAHRPCKEGTRSEEENVYWCHVGRGIDWSNSAMRAEKTRPPTCGATLIWRVN